MNIEEKMNWILIRIDEIKDTLETLDQEQDPNDVPKMRDDLHREWEALNLEFDRLNEIE